VIPVILAFVFIATAIVAVFWFFRKSRPRPVAAAPAENSVQAPLQAIWPVVRHLAGYNRLLPLPGIRDRYARQIDKAGFRFEMSADEFLALKELSALVMAGAAVLVYSTVVHHWAIAASLCFIGLVYPDLKLSSAARKQEQACLRVLPGFLDLLALSVEAGMGFDSAVRKLTEVLEPGPLIRAFQAFLRSMNVGKPRAEALKQMARKLDLPDFTSFANAVIQATETGASMGSVLRAESGEMLFRRFERAEKAAYELPVKILFPLFVFVFPATFLMILGPLYFQFKASGAAGVF
jgi:tight adherence protein C